MNVRRWPLSNLNFAINGGGSGNEISAGPGTLNGAFNFFGGTNESQQARVRSRLPVPSLRTLPSRHADESRHRDQ